MNVLVVTFHRWHHIPVAFHLFREQLASRLSQVFSYQDFTWTRQTSSRDTTNLLRLYSAHCLPWTLHYTWVCLKLTSAKSLASNDSSLSCGSALSGEAVCWPQGHTRVTCLHPCRGRTKINSTNNPKKREFQWKHGFSESGEEGWGMYLVRCGTRRCRSDVFASIYLSKSCNTTL